MTKGADQKKSLEMFADHGSFLRPNFKVSSKLACIGSADAVVTTKGNDNKEVIETQSQ